MLVKVVFMVHGVCLFWVQSQVNVHRRKRPELFSGVVLWVRQGGLAMKSPFAEAAEAVAYFLGPCDRSALP